MYCLATDLGQATDWTAHVLIKRKVERQAVGLPVPKGAEDTRPINMIAYYDVVDIIRPELGTPYTTIADDVSTMMQHPRLRQGCDMVVDATGVGRPVLDMMEKTHGLSPTGIIITGGNQAQMGEDGLWRVPKRQLVSCMQVVLQGGRLAIADLELSPVLETELRKFTMKIRSAGAETYEAWRERDHDDVVLALAMGIWFLENTYGSFSRTGPRTQKTRKGYDPLRA